MEGNIVEQITAKVAALPLEQQREALSLIETLVQRTRANLSLPRSLRLKGSTEGPGPKLALEDLKEARKEM
jgi:hypothetical protein